MKRMILALAFLPLVGCATPEEQARQQQAYITHLRYTCMNYGYKPDTPEFANCMMQTDAQIRQQQQAARMAIYRNNQERLRQQQQQQMELLKQQPQPMRTPTITNCVPMSGQVTCTTY